MRWYYTMLLLVGSMLVVMPISAQELDISSPYYQPVLEVSTSRAAVPRGETFFYAIRISDAITPQPYDIDVGIGTPAGLSPGPITVPPPAYCTIPSTAVVTCHALTVGITQTVTLVGSIFVTDDAPFGDAEVNVVIPGYGVRSTIVVTVEPRQVGSEPPPLPPPSEALPEHHTLYLPEIEQHREMALSTQQEPYALLMPAPEGYEIEDTWPVTDGAALRLFQTGAVPGAAIVEETIRHPSDPDAAYTALRDHIAVSGGADFSFIAGSFGDATTARWRYVAYNGFRAVELLYAIRVGEYIILVDVIGTDNYLDTTVGAQWAARAVEPFYRGTIYRAHTRSEP